MQKNNLKDRAISNNDAIFFPNKGKDRLLSMVEGRPTGVFLDKEFGSSPPIL